MRKRQQLQRIMLSASIGLMLALSGTTRAAVSDDNAAVLDFNEQTHLVFICEEEQLAHDVYRVLGNRFPEIDIFADMEANREHSRCTVLDLLRRYRVSVPRVNDNIGVFSWGIYGRYFMEKYLVLTNQGSTSPLNALYVGAFMEELDIQEISECPKAIVDINNGISEKSACGKGYTDNPEVLRIYESLLDESRMHLRRLVVAIEQQIGAGKYQAQVLSQDEVNAILSQRQLAQP